MTELVLVDELPLYPYYQNHFIVEMQPLQG